MTFNDFISKYDFPGSIVLMVDKSDVKDDDKPLLTSLGHKLASSTKHMIFRSGNAKGADQFSLKVLSEIRSKLLEILIFHMLPSAFFMMT